MKSKFLKLDKACNEKWEDMKPSETGSFCESCSKNVIDFTKLSPFEISEKMQQANGSMCARITEDQLTIPLFDFKESKKQHFPYSKLTASILLATSLTSGPTLYAENTKVTTETVQIIAGTNLGDKQKSTTANKVNPNKSGANAFTIFKGVVTNFQGEPVKKAEITFVTLEKALTAYTLGNGTFVLKIPNELLGKENVIRASYKMVLEEAYTTRDYVLSIEEIKSNYKIKARGPLMILGGMRHSYKESSPIVISDGKEVAYEAFMNAQQGYSNGRRARAYYFDSRAAMALYGEKAVNGLYVFISPFRL